MFRHYPASRTATGHWVLALVLIALGTVAAVTYPIWSPLASGTLGAAAPQADPADHDHASADAHDHEHADHDHSDPNHLDLSPQAQRNIGLETGPVKLDSFERKITIPGMVASAPGGRALTWQRR